MLHIVRLNLMQKILLDPKTTHLSLLPEVTAWSLIKFPLNIDKDSFDGYNQFFLKQSNFIILWPKNITHRILQ